MIQQQQQNHPEDINNESIKVLFKPSKRKKVRKIMLTIEGEFTINNINLVYETIPSVFANYDNVSIKLKNINQIDLTAIQFLHSLKTIYETKGKVISIDSQLSKDDTFLMACAGFSDLIIKQPLV